mmetsp:Transcript_5807/g.10272  ORF Transcript_5807/g.10272 Transcript_5807/m.10272 type:complete len:593 (+) Transcript_5807:397-2175(+)
MLGGVAVLALVVLIRLVAGEAEYYTKLNGTTRACAIRPAQGSLAMYFKSALDGGENRPCSAGCDRANPHAFLIKEDVWTLPDGQTFLILGTEEKCLAFAPDIHHCAGEYTMLGAASDYCVGNVEKFRASFVRMFDHCKATINERNGLQTQNTALENYKITCNLDKVELQRKLGISNADIYEAQEERDTALVFEQSGLKGLCSVAKSYMKKKSWKDAVKDALKTMYKESNIARCKNEITSGINRKVQERLDGIRVPQIASSSKVTHRAARVRISENFDPEFNQRTTKPPSENLIQNPDTTKKPHPGAIDGSNTNFNTVKNNADLKTRVKEVIVDAGIDYACNQAIESLLDEDDSIEDEEFDCSDYEIASKLPAKIESGLEYLADVQYYIETLEAFAFLNGITEETATKEELESQIFGDNFTVIGKPRPPPLNLTELEELIEEQAAYIGELIAARDTTIEGLLDRIDELEARLLNVSQANSCSGGEHCVNVEELTGIVQSLRVNNEALRQLYESVTAENAELRRQVASDEPGQSGSVNALGIALAVVGTFFVTLAIVALAIYLKAGNDVKQQLRLAESEVVHIDRDRARLTNDW